MAKLLIHGAGGHGKVVADIARAAGHEVVGFVDANPDRYDEVSEPGGSRVILCEEELLILRKARSTLPEGAVAVVVAIGDNRTRLEVIAALGDLVTECLAHPSAIVSPHVTLGRGTVLCPRAVINAAATLGIGVIVNTGAIVEHDCVVGDGVHLSPASTLCGGVHVGARSWIGAGATIVPGIVIGEDVIVGAGAVVIRDVPDAEMVIGVPARARLS